MNGPNVNNGIHTGALAIRKKNCCFLPSPRYSSIILALCLQCAGGVFSHPTPNDGCTRHVDYRPLTHARVTRTKYLDAFRSPCFRLVRGLYFYIALLCMAIYSQCTGDVFTYTWSQIQQYIQSKMASSARKQSTPVAVIQISKTPLMSYCGSFPGKIGFGLALLHLYLHRNRTYRIIDNSGRQHKKQQEQGSKISSKFGLQSRSARYDAIGMNSILHAKTTAAAAVSRKKLLSSLPLFCS